MRYEERAAWMCLAGGLLIVIGALLAYRRPTPPVDLGPTLARLERLEKWAEEREERYSRCISVEKMDLTIYPVPNLGMKKVSR